MKVTGERIFYGVVAAALGLSILACGSSSVEGDEGNIKFIYDTGEPTGDNPNFAVGTKIRIRGERIIEESDSEDGEDTAQLSFTDVSSSDSDVIAVRDVPGDSFELESLKSGEATITAEAESDGATISDKVTFEAEEVDDHTLEHRCVYEKSNDGEMEAYLSDQDVFVGMSLKNGSDETIVGYGYYPVSVDGPADVREDHEEVGHLKLHTGTDTGVVTVESDIGSALAQFEVLEASKISALKWYEKVNDVDLGVKVGKEFYLHPVFEVEGRRICNGRTDYAIDVATEDVCDVEAVAGPGGEEDILGRLERPASTLVVEGKEKGTCEFTVALPEVDADIEKDVEVTVD